MKERARERARESEWVRGRERESERKSKRGRERDFYTGNTSASQAIQHWSVSWSVLNSLDCISSTTTTHPVFQTVTGLVGYFRHDHQGSCNKHRGTDGVRDRTHISQHCRVSTSLDKYLTAAGRVLAGFFFKISVVDICLHKCYDGREVVLIVLGCPPCVSSYSLESGDRLFR